MWEGDKEINKVKSKVEREASGFEIKPLQIWTCVRHTVSSDRHKVLPEDPADTMLLYLNSAHPLFHFSYAIRTFDALQSPDVLWQPCATASVFSIVPVWSMRWHHRVSTVVVPPPDHQGSQQPSAQRASLEYSPPCSRCLSHIDLNTQMQWVKGTILYKSVPCLASILNKKKKSHRYPAKVWRLESLNGTHCSGGPYSHCHLSGSLHMAGEWVWSSQLAAGIIWRYRPESLSDWRPWTTPDRAPLRPDAEDEERRI